MSADSISPDRFDQLVTMNERNQKPPRIPSIKPDRDEVAAFQNSRRSEAPKQSNFNGMLAFVIVLMAIMMGIGGFALYEVQLKLEQANALLAEGRRTDADFAVNLTATSSDVNKGLQVLKAQLDVNEDEIRKLWDVSNKRNRGWIKANEAALGKLSMSMVTVEKQARVMGPLVASLQARVDSLNESATQLRDSLANDSEEVTTQVALMRGQVQDAVDASVSNKRQIAILEKKLAGTVNDITAIDTYRLQVNRQLLELRGLVQHNSGTTSPE